MTLPRGSVLLVSGFGDDGYGGLFSFDGSTLTELDDLPTTGISVAAGRLARALRSADDPGRPAEILLYDQRGLIREFAVEAPDPHDLVWLDGTYALVSSLSNSIVEFTERGEIVRRWTAPGEGDAWHLNGLVVVDGAWFVTAFGEFGRHREWMVHGCQGTGFIRDLGTGRNVSTGLSLPHHPRFVDGLWFVCNSAANEVLEIEPRLPQATRRIDLGGFTRGLAISTDHLFVGVSGDRSAERQARARLVVADRATLSRVKEVELPCSEIYDVAIASSTLAAGIGRTPRRLPPRRLPQLDRLSPDHARLRIECELPLVVAADDILALDCAVTNEAHTTVGSVAPFPVHVGYRWERDGIATPEPTRGRLPRVLGPGESAMIRLPLVTPAVPGRYRVTLTGVQEHVAWFDQWDQRNAYSAAVNVVAGSA